jgi:hypothetical protein
MLRFTSLLFVPSPAPSKFRCFKETVREEVILPNNFGARQHHLNEVL